MCRNFWFVSTYTVLLILVSYPVLGQVSFVEVPSNPCGSPVFVTDFNRDGKPDLLCGAVYLGKGDGTFTKVPVTGTPLAVGDFNGDGKPDLVEQGTGTLLVLLGNGDGTFQAPISSPSGASLEVVAAADLNGDGKADVVGFYTSNSNIVVFVYLSEGDGTLSTGVSYVFAANAGVQPILSFGDFKGDGRMDLLFSVSNQEIVLPGNGDGTFGTPVYSAGVPFPVASVIADFNRDAKLDVAVTASTSIAAQGFPNGVYVLIGNGDGTFQVPVGALPGTIGGALGAADVNRDGYPDLIVQGDFDVIQIYLSNGDGTFTNTRSYLAGWVVGGDNNIAGGPIPGVVALADFDSDGKVDLAAGGGISWEMATARFKVFR